MQRIADTSTDSRLSGLEAFLEFWLGPRRAEYGIATEVLDATELPYPLRRFYAFAGSWPFPDSQDHTHRFHIQDILLTPVEMQYFGKVRRMGEYLVFLLENQGVWVAATLPEGDDPGVWISEDCSHRTASPRWRPLAQPLSHFLTSFILQEVVFGSEVTCWDEQGRALDVCRDAGCKIEPIWRNGEYAWPDVQQSYYLVDDRILVWRNGGEMSLGDEWYAFNDPAAADFLRSHNLPYERPR